MPFPPDLIEKARALLARLEAAHLKLASAESCTGGLIAALLTEIPGSSAVFERGFITYSNQSKTELVSVPAAMIAAHGAVSAEVAAAMARGALHASQADIAISVTGIAGPSGGTSQKPVGLVYIGLASGAHGSLVRRFEMDAATRSAIRLSSVEAALALLSDCLDGKLSQVSAG